MPPKDYYDHMYDIEDLTHLNAKIRPRSAHICAFEEMIREQHCSETVRGLRPHIKHDVFAQMLVSALWAKDRIFFGMNKTFSDKSPKSCALEELSEYLERTPVDIQQEMLVEVPVEKDWEQLKINPADPADVLRFYKETDSYVYELMAANNIIQTLFTFSTMAERLQKLGVQNVLDYGGGAGTLSILLCRLGYDVTYADVTGKTFDFAKWRFQKRNLNIPMVELAGNERTDLLSPALTDHTFDCILSTEVIEHVPHPLDLITSFAQKLPLGGIAVVSESCNYTEQFTSHLESNKKYGGAVFIEHMKEAGLHLLEYDVFIPQQIFIKR